MTSLCSVNCYRAILKLGKPISRPNKRSVHVYKSIHSWKTTVEFSKYLFDTSVYNDNGLIVLNKPYGITFSRDRKSPEEGIPDPESHVFEKKTSKSGEQRVFGRYFTSGVTSDSLNLLDCLPFLREQFKTKELHIARVPEKFASGVALLTTSKELVDKINDDRARCPLTGKDTYLAVVAGIPRYDSGKIKLAFKLDHHPKYGTRVVLMQKWSNNEYKRGQVRIGTFHYQTICKGHKDLSSLLEIRVDLRKYHAYRVFAADYLLAPVLGDNLFSGRVQKMMGVTMSVNHFSESANSPQVLPPEIYSMLDLTENEGSCIPVHIHLHQMVLPRYLPDKKDVVVSVPVPDHFQWTCEKLGLQAEKYVNVAAG